MQLINENKEEIPKMWPALHNMVIDDQERLWILTITDSDSTYKGWVLNKKGELMAKFNWSGSRNERTPEVSPLFKIKNGYLYTRERDIRKGIDRIVKYKIIFKEQ
ncbi:MAG: hypothetical protein U5J95_02725 [Balneolaceae bacterium]|nr:hypothetical protein [Balneolaceae bacterium]